MWIFCDNLLMAITTIKGAGIPEDIEDPQLYQESGMGTLEDLRGDLITLASIRREMFETYWERYKGIWDSASMSAWTYGAPPLQEDTTPNRDDLMAIFDKHTLKNADVNAHRQSFANTIEVLEQTAGAAMKLFIKYQRNQGNIVQELFGIKLRGIVTVRPTPVGLNFEVWEQKDANEIARAHYNLERKVHGEEEFEGEFNQDWKGLALSGNFDTLEAEKILTSDQRQLLPSGITVVNRTINIGLNNEEALEVIKHEVFHQFNLLYSPEEYELSEEELGDRLADKLVNRFKIKMEQSPEADINDFIKECLQEHSLLVRKLTAVKIREEMLAQASKTNITWDSIAKEIKRAYLLRFSPIVLTIKGYRAKKSFTEKQNSFITSVKKALELSEGTRVYSQDFVEKVEKFVSTEGTMQNLYKFFDPNTPETDQNSWYKEVLEFTEYANYLEKHLCSREVNLGMLYSIPISKWDTVAKLFGYKNLDN